MRRPHVAAATAILAALTATTAFGLLYGRPLPTIDGHYRFLGLHARAEVIRDEFGIPRIYASDAHDLFFLQGYITAQDRFAQMDEMRSAARARALGGAAIASEALDAYAAGVTKYIEQHRERRALPAEVVLSGRSPAPWSAVDSLAILDAYLGRLQIPARCLALPGDRTIRGRPLLGAEVRSSMPMPGWYEIGLDAGEVQGLGLSMPGVPGIVAGHNAWVAWAIVGPRERDAVPALHGMLSLLPARSLEGARPATASVVGCFADIAGGVIGEGGPSAETGRVDIEALRTLLGEPWRANVAGRVIVDLGHIDASKAAISLGQSAHRASRHYRDQTALWEAGQLHRLAWTRGAVERVAAQLVLRPR